MVSATLRRAQEAWFRIAREARTIYWRDHDQFFVRLWVHEDMDTDRFEVVSRERFACMQTLASLGFRFVLGDD